MHLSSFLHHITQIQNSQKLIEPLLANGSGFSAPSYTKWHHKHSPDGVCSVRLKVAQPEVFSGREQVPEEKGLAGSQRQTPRQE